ncbi:MAG: signal peptidase I [Thermoflexales bacterium]|nr:signal peptidase I [Thermoflexales bacterium]
MAVLVPAALVVALVNLFVVQAVLVQDIDQVAQPKRLLVEKISYRWHGPRRGDVVVLGAGGKLVVGRVMALPGETLERRDGRVTVDGQPLDEAWPGLEGGDFPRVTVPPLNILIGDSIDSRSFELAPIETIAGRACFVYWPPERVGPVR